MQKIPKHEKPNIDINLDFTEENLGYQHNLNITDDDIYYYWGKKYFVGFRQGPTGFKSKLRKTMKNASKEELIEYAKTHFRSILPDEEEFIPRKYWASFEELMGEDLRLLHHPIWWLTQRYIRENFVPCSNVLMIQACSNIKPYYDNPTYRFTRKRFEEGYFDLVVNSCELVPIEFTLYYPFRHYDWSHLRETELVTDSLIRNNFHSIVSFINTFHYKKVLLYGPSNLIPTDTFYTKLYNMLVENYKGTDVEIIFIMDEETSLEALKATNNKKGFFKLRYMNLLPTKRRIDSLINYRGPLREYVYGSSIKKLVNKKSQLDTFLEPQKVEKSKRKYKKQSEK